MYLCPANHVNPSHLIFLCAIIPTSVRVPLALPEKLAHILPRNAGSKHGAADAYTAACQSVPHAVCTMNRPSCPRRAASRTSASSGRNRAQSRESVFRVTGSRGVPDAICIARAA
jgi:hypothetical protein